MSSGMPLLSPCPPERCPLCTLLLPCQHFSDITSWSDDQLSDNRHDNGLNRRVKYVNGIGSFPLPPLAPPVPTGHGFYARQNLLVGKQTGFHAAPPTPLVGTKPSHSGTGAFLKLLKSPESRNPEFLAQLQQIITMENLDAQAQDTVSEEAWTLQTTPCLLTVDKRATPQSLACALETDISVVTKAHLSSSKSRGRAKKGDRRKQTSRSSPSAVIRAARSEVLREPKEKQRIMYITCRLCGSVGTVEWHQKHVAICSGLSNERRERVKDRSKRIVSFGVLQEQAALVIQRNYRGLLGRQIAGLKFEVLRAVAQRLQNAWRQKVARRRRWKLKRDKNRNKLKGILKAVGFFLATAHKRRHAATCIQKGFRVFFFRHHWGRFNAAKVIQRNVRKKQAWQVIRQARAVQVMVKNMRTWLVRRRFKRYLFHVTKISRWWRHCLRVQAMKHSIREVVRPTKAVRVISRAYSTYRWRKHIACLFSVRPRLISLQASWRGRRGRRKAIAYREFRAAAVIQGLFRRFKARRWRKLRLILYNIASKKISRWIWRCRLRRQAHRNWAWLYKNKLWLLDGATMMRIECWRAHGTLQYCFEGRRVFHSAMASFWQSVYLLSGPNELIIQRAKVVRLYLDSAPLIRSLFLKFSTKGVTAPERAFRVNRLHFQKFAKDAGFFTDKVKNAIDRLFQVCCKKMMFKCSNPIPTFPNLPTPAKPVDKLVMLRDGHNLGPPMEFNSDRVLKRSKRAGRVPLKAYLHDECEPVFSDLLELDGFFEMLLRLSDVLYSEGRAMTDQKSVSEYFERLLTEYITPFAEEIAKERATELQELKTGSDNVETQLVFTKHDSSLRKLFAHFCSIGNRADQGGKWAREDCVSVAQFLTFAKDCKISSLGISFSICLDIFVTVNEDEVEQYLGGQLPYLNLSDALQMDFHEFLLALVVMTRRGKLSDAHRKLPREEQLDVFIKKLLKLAPSTVLKESDN